MNKLHLLFFLFLSVSLITLTSCDDDDDNDNVVAPSRMELLTQKEWIGTDIYMDGVNSTQWMLDNVNVDIKKWQLMLNENGNYTSSLENLFDESGTWEFANNEQSIIFDKGDPIKEEIVQIVKLTSTELFLDETLEVVYDDGTAGEVEGVMRFRH